MEKIYEYRNEKFVYRSRRGRCDYTVKHTEWDEPVLTLHLNQDISPNTYSWAGKGPTVSIGKDGSFKNTLDACCKPIISHNSKVQPRRNGAKRAMMPSRICADSCSLGPGSHNACWR